MSRYTHIYFFPRYLFYIESKPLLTEAEILKRFVYGGHNVNNIAYAKDIVLIEDRERRSQNHPEIIVKESETLIIRKQNAWFLASGTTKEASQQMTDAKVKQAQNTDGGEMLRLEFEGA